MRRVRVRRGRGWPSRLIELLGQGERLGPGALGQRRVEVFVGLAFDDQHAEAKPVVGLDERVVEVLAEPLRYFRNGQCRQLAAKPADFRVEGVTLVAS